MNFTVSSFRRYALYSTYVMLTRLDSDTLVHVTCVTSASLRDMIYNRGVGRSKNLEGGTVLKWWFRGHFLGCREIKV